MSQNYNVSTYHTKSQCGINWLHWGGEIGLYFSILFGKEVLRTSCEVNNISQFVLVYFVSGGV